MSMDRIGSFLNAGIAGSQVTPLKLMTVIALLVVLVWQHDVQPIGSSITCWRGVVSTLDCGKRSERSPATL